MKTHFLQCKPTGVLDENGLNIKEYTFQYTLPLKTENGFVDSAVCGNAYSWAFGLGKNTRTDYEKAIRAEMMKTAPTDVSARVLR